jgi:SDR family mycofactocin-dependent oxidoreductase
MGKLDGKVAFITGGARGQGRSHAVTLAGEGANVAIVDMGDRRLDYPKYPVATKAELDETVKQVEALGREALGLVANVREDDEVKAAVDATIKQFGHIDIVVANAGIADKITPFWEITRENWDGMIANNLTSVWLTCKYTAPHLMAQKSGSIILISSIAGIKGLAGLAHYNASKFAVRGLAKTFANELGEFGIRVNSIHPGTVDTPMVDAIAEMVGTPKEAMIGGFVGLQIFQMMLDPKDISAGVLYLASDDSRYVTGLELVIDGGWITK